MWSRLLQLGRAVEQAGQLAKPGDGPLLDALLTVDYKGRTGALRKVPVSVACGEILGLAGESGSGKSTVALALMSLAGRRGGTVRGHALWRGTDLLAAGERTLRRLRGREIALMLQNPMAALNPRLRLATQFREAWRAHAPASRAWEERALDTLARLGLPDGEALLRKYPGELSIGMAQRVLLALTILHRPKLLIADEPTSALDVITQSEVLALFRRVRSEFGMALLIISHDLLALASVCDRITVLRSGEVVETVAATDLFTAAEHEYTRKLVAALPRPPAAPRNATPSRIGVWPSSSGSDGHEPMPTLAVTAGRQTGGMQRAPAEGSSLAPAGRLTAQALCRHRDSGLDCSIAHSEVRAPPPSDECLCPTPTIAASNGSPATDWITRAARTDPGLVPE